MRECCRLRAAGYNSRRLRRHPNIRGIAMSRRELLHGRNGRTRALRLAPALGCIVLLAVAVIFSANVSGRDQGIADAVTKTNAFLATLDAPQREKVLLDFDSGKKPTWSNLPVTM